MAGHNSLMQSARAPKGIAIEDNRYIGTKRDLLAAGIITTKNRLPQKPAGCCDNGEIKITMRRDGRLTVWLSEGTARTHGVPYLADPCIDVPDPDSANFADAAIQFERTVHCRTYTGTHDDLIASGIAVETMFPEAPKRITHGSCSEDSPDHSWGVTKIKGGLFRLRVWFKHLSPIRAPESGSQRDADVKSADDYRWLLQNFLPVYSGLGPAAVSKFDDLKGADGYVYNITAESREQIEEALEELLAAIHDAEISRRKFDGRSDEEKSAARELLAKAEADPKFQKFIGRLGLPRPGSTP